jgi:hypothetical protein
VAASSHRTLSSLSTILVPDKKWNTLCQFLETSESMTQECCNVDPSCTSSLRIYDRKTLVHVHHPSLSPNTAVVVGLFIWHSMLSWLHGGKLKPPTLFIFKEFNWISQSPLLADPRSPGSASQRPLSGVFQHSVHFVRLHAFVRLHIEFHFY